MPRKNLFETGDAGLFCDNSGCSPDRVMDDQSLVIAGNRGLVLLVGCSHAGLINTIEYARLMTGIDEVYAVIGGTHLGLSDAIRLDETVRALRGFRINKLCASHCTGFAASARLYREFPGPFLASHVGFTVEV